MALQEGKLLTVKNQLWQKFDILVWYTLQCCLYYQKSFNNYNSKLHKIKKLCSWNFFPEFSLSHTIFFKISLSFPGFPWVFQKSGLFPGFPGSVGTLLLRTCFPNAPTINSHSFHIGGASAAASAGVADSTIQILGRWTNNAYHRYIRISDDLVCDLTRRVASVNSCTRQWDTDNSRSVWVAELKIYAGFYTIVCVVYFNII